MRPVGAGGRRGPFVVTGWWFRGLVPKIEKFAEAAHGLVLPAVVDTDEVLKTKTVEKRARSGHLERVAPHLYRVPGSPRSWHQLVRGAVEAAGPGAMASHGTAAALWGLPGFRQDPDLIEITRPRARKHPGLIGRVHESRKILDAHRGRVDDIPVSTPPRTLFDLCGSRACHPRRAERAVANALNAQLARFGDLEVTLVQMGRRGRRGSALFRRILDDAGAAAHLPTEGELEKLVLAVLTGAGLALPECQVELGDETRWIGRVDFFYRGARLVIEGDSRRHHGSWLDAEHDRRRDALLTAAGYRVIRVTWRQLREEPELFVAAVEAVLAEAAEAA